MVTKMDGGTTWRIELLQYAKIKTSFMDESAVPITHFLFYHISYLRCFLAPIEELASGLAVPDWRASHRHLEQNDDHKGFNPIKSITVG